MQNSKKVRFNENVTVHYMIYWDFAYREARKGTWKQEIADRCRFTRRVQELDLMLGPYLKKKIEKIFNKYIKK